MPTIYLWGNKAEKAEEKLRKAFKVKWSKKKRRFYRHKLDNPTLKKITSYCLKNRINYKTNTGQSYELIESEFLETSSREIKEWGSNISKGTPYLDEVDYEQM